MEKIFVVLKLSKGGDVYETDTLFDRYLYMQRKKERKLDMLLGMTNFIILSTALYSSREDYIKPKRN